MQNDNNRGVFSQKTFLQRVMHRLKWQPLYWYFQIRKSIHTFTLNTAQRGTHFSIKPLHRKDIVLCSLPTGEYTLLISHNDTLLKALRKSLLVSFHASDESDSGALAKELNLPMSAQGNPFCYVGGGKTSEGLTKQFVNFTLDYPRPWVKITLRSTLDRYINIDNLRIYPRGDKLSRRATFLPNTTDWLNVFDKRPDFTNLEFAIYADISMNTVDGSSIWLSSMISCLARSGKTLVISKHNITSNIVVDNILHKENVIFLTPQDVGLETQEIDVASGITILREIDHYAPHLRRIILRGLAAAKELCDNRQFYQRSCIYLTDFYSILDGKINISEQQAQDVSIITRQAGHMLIQAPSIQNKIQEITQTIFQATSFPPPIPDNLPKIEQRSPLTPPYKIGYAGKITPEWGISELLDWTLNLRQKGYEIELYIVANRVSDGTGTKRMPGFAETIHEKIKALNARHYNDFNREKAMSMMADMDFVWCYRPESLEENTLELSTKLVEMVGAGAVCVCYPSATNRAKLGEAYPFFVTSQDDLEGLLQKRLPPPSKDLAKRIKQEHSLNNIAVNLTHDVLGLFGRSNQTILFAGHDFKFIDPYISELKASAHTVLRDVWGWGNPILINSSMHLLKQADIIFCEWGLANAVWYSQNKLSEQKLFVRIHLQEINERAKKFGHQINFEAVDKFIFVSDSVRKTAIEMFSWPEEKTVTIPNFVLDREYKLQPKHTSKTIHLGMVGIIPQRKRLDRAVKLLSKLISSGKEAHLHIKGPRPEELAFMRAPSRLPELDYYNEIYNQIDNTCIKRAANSRTRRRTWAI